MFNLFDALKRVGRFFKKKRRVEPRIRFFPEPIPDTRHPIIKGLRQGELPPPPPPPPPAVAGKKVDDGMVSAASLVRRLMACADPVTDIPRQARRLAQWQARPKEERRPERWEPLRSGRPPGYRQRNLHAVDEILKDCDWLARLGNPPIDDTS